VLCRQAHYSCRQGVNQVGRDIIRTQVSSDCELQSCNQFIGACCELLAGGTAIAQASDRAHAAGELSNNDESLLQGCVSHHADRRCVSHSVVVVACYWGHGISWCTPRLVRNVACLNDKLLTVFCCSLCIGCS